MVRERRFVRIGGTDYPDHPDEIPDILYDHRDPLRSLWEIRTALKSFPTVRVMRLDLPAISQLEAQLHDTKLENETFTQGQPRTFRPEAKIMNAPFALFITRTVAAPKRKRK